MTSLSSGATAGLLFVLSAIVAVAFLGGSVAARLGQPRVIGEIAVGLAIGAVPLFRLGPTSESPLPIVLQSLSTVGLVLFMFLVGVELQAPDATRAWRGATLVGLGSVLVPFGLGVALATTLVAPAGRSLQFVLFLGVSLSVTAFPVLARILRERANVDATLSATAMKTAAVADVLAWTLLIGVLASGSLQSRPLPLLLLLVPYAGALVAVRRTAPRFSAERLAPPAGLALIIAGLAASAAFTEWLGLHSIIGAFAFGAALPTDRVRELREKLPSAIGPLVTSLLLPPFFVLSGMHADLSAAAAGGVPMMLALLGVAIAGKAGGTVLGARLGGFDAPTCARLAALMNTRGLTELIVLDIGRQSGLLTPGLYSLLVLMAVVTTAMTTPALALLDRLPWRSRSEPAPLTAHIT